MTGMRAAKYVLLLLAAPLLLAQAPRFDVLITGGRIVDGAGGAWFYGDVGIRGDSIAAIGRLEGAAAETVIDARGMVVAPGFIDIHSHGRRGILRTPTAENYLREGVTTIMEGPDGSSPLPIAQFSGRDREDADLGEFRNDGGAGEHPRGGDRAGEPQGNAGRDRRR